MSHNPFLDPGALRKKILGMKLLPTNKLNTSGKSLACLFLTRFCPVGCSFCFYKSMPSWRKKNIEDQFDDEGISKFIKFTQHANLGYLLISGGGEPMTQRKHILDIIRYAKVDRVVLVTSAVWAKSIAGAQRYLSDIADRIRERNDSLQVVVRVSISSGHVANIGCDPARNLFDIFDSTYKFNSQLKLQVKSFLGDSTLKSIIDSYPGANLVESNIPMQSDNNLLIKKIPTQHKMVFKSGYTVVVGMSKIFSSTMTPDLSSKHEIEAGIKVFNEDLDSSEDSNPSLVFNDNGAPGIDWSINYNGDICTWQNQVRDNYMNLYEDDFDAIYNATFEDPITYSFLDKGCRYRENIVAEVNPRAVLRMQAIGLRDTSGAIIFEEEKTRLYFCIRVIQDYVDEGVISANDLSFWPQYLRELVLTSKKELISLYHQSSFSIISQQKNKDFIEVEWLDLFRLIRLSHYDLTESEVEDAIKFYNSRADKKIKSIYDDLGPEGDLERRLTERVMHIKPLKRFSSQPCFDEVR